MIMTGGFRQEPAGHNFFTPGGVYTKCKGVYNKCCICAALCAANRTEKEQRRRMEQKRTAPRAQKTQPLTYREWKRRKQLRLARNWGLFLAGCALAVFLLTKGILWLLPHLHGADGPQIFAASAYDGVYMAVDAMKRAGSITDHKKIRDALAAMKDFKGVCGTFSFDDKRDPVVDLILMKMKDGKYSMVDM